MQTFIYNPMLLTEIYHANIDVCILLLFSYHKYAPSNFIRNYKEYHMHTMLVLPFALYILIRYTCNWILLKYQIKKESISIDQYHHKIMQFVPTAGSPILKDCAFINDVGLDGLMDNYHLHIV